MRSLGLLLTTIAAVAADTSVVPQPGNSPDATPGSNPYGTPDTPGYVVDGIHSGDIGVGSVVVLRDAIHHGTGLAVSVPAENDNVRDGMSNADIAHSLANAENDALKADIEAHNNLDKVLNNKQQLANKKAQLLKNKLNRLKQLHNSVVSIQGKPQEIYSKQTTPVITFPSGGVPLAHHARQIVQQIQEQRAYDKAVMENSMKLEQLHDATDAMRNLNPGATNANDYQKRVIPVDPSKGIFAVETDARNGAFFINTAEGNAHAPDAIFHANAPGGFYPLASLGS